MWEFNICENVSNFTQVFFGASSGTCYTAHDACICTHADTCSYTYMHPHTSCVCIRHGFSSSSVYLFECLEGSRAEQETLLTSHFPSSTAPLPSLFLLFILVTLFIWSFFPFLSLQLLFLLAFLTFSLTPLTPHPHSFFFSSLSGVFVMCASEHLSLLTLSMSVCLPIGLWMHVLCSHVSVNACV